MSGRQRQRRPVSRRLMLALFGLMIVPVCGWYFLGDLVSGLAGEALPGAGRELVSALQHELRFKLAVTLGVSVVVLGVVIAYVRRTVLDPLERLAVLARDAEARPWVTPADADRTDEVGDLARALDRGMTRLQQRAEEAERFATDLSHELRTPLAAIRGAAEILSEPELDDPDRRRFAANILSEAERLERFVATLLLLARCEREAVASGPAEIPAVVARVSEALEPLLAERSIEIETVMSDDLAPARAGEQVVTRVLTVLLENAIRHSPPRGRIRISASPADGGVEVAVEDQGPGVPEDLRGRIFERWFTADRGPERACGTGLGLAIARTLVERLGGSITVDPSELGGARFRVVLPAAG